MRASAKCFVASLVVLLTVDVPATTIPIGNAFAFDLRLGPVGFHLGFPRARSRAHRRYQARQSAGPRQAMEAPPPGGDAGPVSAVRRLAASGAITGAVAAATFEGFQQTSQAEGFDRNRLGTADDWTAWATRSWGAGWNQWGTGWGYWTGPVFWPFAYGDAVSYALWPGATYDPFFVNGPDFLLNSILWPGPFDDQGSPKIRSAAETIPACGGLAPSVADLPIGQIDQAIQPRPEQKALLRDLQRASDRAKTALAAACPSSSPATVVARLDAVGLRLTALRKALTTIRDPLTKLYNSLDDQQRSSLAGIGEAEGKADRPETDAATTDKVKTSTTLVDFCQKQAANFSLLPVTRTSSVVQPVGEQQITFDNFQSAAAMAASELTISCPSSLPQGLSERLAAVLKRIDALNGAVQELKAPLTRFYESIDDDQKARINVIGAAADADKSDDKPPKG